MSDLCRQSWDATFRQPMAETLTELSFLSDKAEHDKRELEKMQRRYARHQ